MTVRTERRGAVLVVTIDRPAKRNAVDGPTARALIAAAETVDADPGIAVGVLTGAGGTFCAGADLTVVAEPGHPDALQVAIDGDGPLGVTRRTPTKPWIAAVEGHAVAGGLELALWCDLRVAAEDAVFGVYCRRWGVPLVDGGTVRLPRVVGHGRALDMILTGRGVQGGEALAFGLANRLVAPGQALGAAVSLADEIAALPQECLRNDRASAVEQWDLPLTAALRNEARHGMRSLAGGEAVRGAADFRAGLGRHGAARTTPPAAP